MKTTAGVFPLPPYDPEILAVEDTQHRPIPSDFQELVQLRKEETRDETILNDPYISITNLSIPGPVGTIPAIVLAPKVPRQPCPGVLFIHGGGRVMGNVFVGLSAVSHLVKELDAVVISTSYRLSPDHPGMASVEDCYASLVWMSKNLGGYSIDRERFIIAGVSAGAGLAAGTALLARDRGGPRVCAQLLVCPTLDDRCTSISSLQFENGRSFYTAWNRYAWSCIGPSDVYVAPGRAEDLSNLPPAYIDAGSGEPFRDEDIAYAMKL
ncbi:hypothetical protein QQX98_012493 [Neonectria punicea]|uniref:Alpha/beta hydrolase fold-3 domain-containing protein n=1 Tax=Neonectria punicea TaxID=979145 RepID=A0ABR1GIQ2_9HYPO